MTCPVHGAHDVGPGDIANADGDIWFSLGRLAVAEGRVAVSFVQALKAIPFGWRWADVESDGTVHLQRGPTPRCRSVRPACT